MLSFKDKYLKYKKKYVLLKDQIINLQKGSAISNRCVRNDPSTSISSSTFIDIPAIYSINQICGYFYKQARIIPPVATSTSSSTSTPPIPLCPNIDFKVNGSNVLGINDNDNITNISFNHYVQPNDTSKFPNTLQRIYQSTYNLDLGIPKDLGTTQIQYYKEDTGSTIIPINPQIIHQNISSSYLSDIIGKNFKLSCDEAKIEPLLKTFYDSDNNIVVIDFANIVGKLSYSINAPQSMTISAQKSDYKRSILIKQINLLIYNYLRKGDFVFIIFRKTELIGIKELKEIIYKQKYNLADYIKDQYSNLQILCVECSTDFNAVKSIYDGPITSSVDDFVFWIVVVFLQNLIRNRNIHSTNQVQLSTRLILLTNDKQKLDHDFLNIARPVVGPNIGGSKNLFDLKMGYNFTEFSTSGNQPIYSIYTYYLRHDGNISMANGGCNFFFANDIMLNRYINFIYNLFANTPVKLNPKPRNYIINVTPNDPRFPNVVNIEMNNFRKNYYNFSKPNYLGYIFNRNHSVLNPLKNRNRHFNDRLNITYTPIINNLSTIFDNIEANVALYELFQSDNKYLAGLRTDIITHLIFNFPIEGTGKTDGSFINLFEYVNTQLDLGSIYLFSDFVIHPGLCFYAQIKTIQYLIYEQIHGSLDDMQILNKTSIYNNFISIVDDLESEIIKLNNIIDEHNNSVHKDSVTNQTINRNNNSTSNTVDK